MGVVLPNGKIFDMFGPFYSDGDHSDEWMWEWIVDDNTGNYWVSSFRISRWNK